MQLINAMTQFGAACRTSFLGIPSWYKYLPLDAQCRIKELALPGDLTLVALALIDMLLYIAGLVAVVFVIYGGAQYITSQGNPDQATKARDSIINALLGLAIALIAIAVVSFFGRKLSS